MRQLLVILLACMGLSLLPAAAQDDLDTVKADFVATYAEIVFASYEDSLTLANSLKDTIAAFVEAPSQETFEAARQAWLAAREPYGQTEAYRFYGGPIDDSDGPEGLINAWPLDEVYIDYIEGNPEAGIINNPDQHPEITSDLLMELNEQGAEENIATGFHAIEFLLWGQDLSEEGPGSRPYTDYTTAPNAERRAQYLTIAADLLVQHLSEVTAAWDPAVEDNYRAEFLALDPDESVQRILTGMGVLAKSELSGERMFTAYDNQDQEDEHSCFSDNTHRDIITNLMGIENIYHGTYTRIDGTVMSGTGFQDVVALVDSSLNESALQLLTTADEQVNAISVPFDQAIIQPSSRPTVLEAVFTLQDLGDMLAEIAIAMDISINTALPA
jgi:putative iron-regulated protein